MKSIVDNSGHKTLRDCRSNIGNNKFYTPLFFSIRALMLNYETLAFNLTRVLRIRVRKGNFIQAQRPVLSLGADIKLKSRSL